MSLQAYFKKKLNRANLQECPFFLELTGLDLGLHDMVERFDNFEAKEIQLFQVSRDIEVAENRSLKTFIETKGRLSFETDYDVTSPKQRKGRAGSERFSYLREKSEQELSIK